MKFEYPNVLYFLFLLLIPIILHLFNFRKYKTIYFSNLQFIKNLEEENQATKKIKRILILISRLLALSFIVIAFAKPFINKTNNTKGKNLYCFYLDNSFSMALQGTSGELFSMAKEKIRKIADETEREAKFMLVSNQFDGIEQQILSKADFLENLEQLNYSSLKKSVSDVIQFIDNSLESDLNSYNINLFLISDFQKSNLKKSTWTKSNSYTIYPIQLIAQKYENISLDSIWFERPNFKKGINNEIFIKIKNYSNADQYNIEIGLEINKTKRNAICDIKKNSEKIISINYTDQETGTKKGRVWLNDNNIIFDDDFYFTYDVNESSPILIADGEDAVPNIKSVYSLEKYYHINQCLSTNFTPDKLENINLLILNGWNEVSEAANNLINEFINKGGSIAVFPGNNIKTNKFNSFLQKISLPNLQNLSSISLKVKNIAYQDEFFNGVFESKPKNLFMPLQNKIYPLVNSKSSYTPLITYENGQALFVKSINKSCYLFLSPLHDDAGNIKKNALFSTILFRIAENAIRTYPLFLTIGSSKVFPLKTNNLGESPIKLKSNDIEFVPEQYKDMGLTYISVQSSSIQKTQKPGFYDVFSDKILGVIAINNNREESNIAVANNNEIQSYLNKLGFNEINYSSFENENDVLQLVIKKEIEYWRLFVFFALIFILVELMLIKWMKD